MGSGDGLERPGRISSWAREGSRIDLDFGGPLLSVTVLTDADVRIRLAPRGAFAQRRSWAVAAPDDSFAPVDLAVENIGDRVRIATAGMRIEIRDGGRVDIDDAQGRAVLHDGRDGGPAWAGERAIWTKRMPSGTGYYGFGERTGLLDKRGLRYTCWTTDEWRHQGPNTDELYVAVPFFLGVDETGASF